jgi:soluble lytic murein transglycosylase-like protein
VLFAKSPGGAVATAERVARWRPLVERAAAGGDVDPDVLEGIVFLESAGRADARARTTWRARSA